MLAVESIADLMVEAKMTFLNWGGGIHAARETNGEALKCICVKDRVPTSLRLRRALVYPNGR